MEFCVGSHVKAYLKSKGIAQAFISERTGIPAATLSERLNGKSEFRARELYAIGELLGVPLETFRRPPQASESEAS